MTEWAARDFQEYKGPSGYTFLHLPTNKRMTRSVVRKKLTLLGVQNKRIINIHFPTIGIIALLIHQDYKQPLTDLLTAKSIPITQFNPACATVIRDPKLNHLSDEEKEEKALAIYQARLLRICQAHPHRHLGAAILRHFNSVEGPFHITDIQLSEFFNSGADFQTPTSANETETPSTSMDFEHPEPSNDHTPNDHLNE
jgi:hypothetical protein